jgi:hypothetical protein
MAGQTTVRSSLAPVFAAVLQRPELVERAARAYSRWPESAEVLGGSLDSLWRTILAPDSESPTLEREQKAWLLLHAGLLRGFNLALITAWRPSGDTLPALEAAYPGLLGFGEALHSQSRDLWVPRTSQHHVDDRRVVESVTAEARALLQRGLERGYGLGFLVDAALDGPRIPPDSPPAAVATLLLPLVETSPSDDDPGLRAVAESWPGGLTRADRSAILAGVLADPLSRHTLEAAIGRETRARPLAVPANLDRYSPAYVCTHLAYLLRWWAAVGLRLGHAEAEEEATPPSVEATWHRYPIRHWLAAKSIAWAREETGEVIRLSGVAASLRWQLVYLAQQYCAVGWSLARALEGD